MKKIKKISMLLLAMGALVGVAACDSKAQTPATDNTSNNTNEGNDKTPTDGGEITPSTGGDTTPTDGGETTPSTGGDTTPSTGGDTTPSTGGTEQVTTKYKVTFNTNGGSSINDQNIESGKTISSVTTAKEGCTFAGWYTDSSLTKSFNVTTPITATTTLYAKWNVTITFNTNSGTAITSQTIASGEAISTVSTSRSGYDFAGWYTDSELKNVFDVTTPITKSLTLYAKWTLKTTPGDIINDSSAYNEGAFVSFDLPANSTTKNATVSYSADGTNWTNIDSELISYDFTAKIAKAYILGLKAGSYVVKVNNGEKVSTTKTLYVSADDRSGYAHFNNTTGVGAYNNDGTLKNNAVVVYVNEANKNTVQATYGGKTYTGLYNILKNSSASYPLDIRVLGTIGAPTITPTNLVVTKLADKKHEVIIKNKSGNTLSSSGADQSTLISGGYATLDDKYTELNGLTSKIKSDGTETYNGTTYNAFDSYYNMMDISSKNNITVEGVGIDATIAQWGFTWKNCNYIEVKNLTFNDYPEDACSFEGSDTSATTLSGLKTGNIWVHNNTFNIGKNEFDVSYEQDKHEGDGATDFKGLKNVTIAYNHYYKNHKTGLLGGDGTHHQANITFHHNWYQENQARLPYGRQANMHMYNNFYDSSTGTNMQIHDGGYAFIENCYFKNTSKTFEVKTNKTSQVPAIKSYNNIYDNCGNYNIDKVTITTDRTATVTNDNFISSTFDTDSSLFYYDSTNKKSDVTIMNQASELPTLIPTVAGAGTLPNFNLGSFTDIDTSSSGSESGSGSTDTPTKYTVTFETNGGTAITTQEVTSGNKISTVSTSKDNYTFAGWYTDSSLTKSFDVTTPITGPITLYAKWEATSSQSTTSTVLTFNNFATGTLSSETTVDNLKLILGKTVEIKTCNTTVNETTISKCVKIGGKGDYSSACVQFSTTATANITVYYAAGSGRVPVLYNSNGEVEKSNIETTTESDIKNYTFNNVEAGTYSIASSSSSMHFYAIVITY